MKHFDAQPHPGGSSWGAPARTISQFLEDETSGDEEILLADGFEDAFLGIGQQFSKPPFAVYDRKKCIAILMKDIKLEWEAEEFFEFNVQGAWVGENTPVFVTTL